MHDSSRPNKVSRLPPISYLSVVLNCICSLQRPRLPRHVEQQESRLVRMHKHKYEQDEVVLLLLWPWWPHNSVEMSWLTVALMMFNANTLMY